MVVAGAWRTVRRNRDYRSELAFFESNRDADGCVPRCRLALGLLYEDQGLGLRAEEEYRTALRLWPGYLKARLALASFLMSQHRVAEALSLLEAADARNDPELRHQLGKACWCAGRKDEALRHLRAAAALAPERGAIRQDLGILLLEQGQAGEAAMALRAVLDVSPGAPVSALYHLVVACRKAGQRVEAERFFEMLRRRDPALAAMSLRPAPQILRPVFF